jgi:hypothetical protein
MRNHLIALTVAVGMVGLGAAGLARAGAPGVSITGGVSAGGAMAAHGGGGMHGGGGGFAGGRAGGAGFAGSHFGGGGYAGGHFDGVRIVGGSYGGAVAAAGLGRAATPPRGSYVVHNDFVAHGGHDAAGHAPLALAARGGMAGGVGEAARTDTMALGPRLGSAAAAVRVNPMSRVDRMIRPHPGVRPPRPPARNPQTMQAKAYPRPQQGYSQSLRQPPIFCDLPAVAMGVPQPFGCPQPVKTKMEMR